MPKLTLPYNWEPRPYQMDFWRAMQRGCRRAMLVWHRRAGKDLTAFNWAVLDMAALHPGGQWWHVWPTYEQGRKGFWEGADNTGRRYIDYIPPELVKRKRDDMMMLELKNGSIYRIVGAEDPDRLVGANPVGLIMTEFSLHNPAAWDYLRPILAANDGTAIFPFTPRGRNHAHQLLVNVRHDPNWLVDIKPLDVTRALPLSVLDEERAAGMSEELVKQEYFCLDPKTKVLTADLRWVEIQTLQPGDELVGVDENGEARTGRKFRRAVVEAAWSTHKPCYRIQFEGGLEIVASGEHPWLVKRKPVKRKHKTYSWIETRELGVGMTVADSGLAPWETDESRGGGYLAGMYDGEGCVSRATVQVSQRPGRVLDEVMSRLSERGFEPWRTTSGGCHTLSLPLHASLRLLGTVRPPRLLESAAGVWEGRFPFNGVPPRRIVSVEPVGDRPVVGISTSTRTFIAEGLVTHNCSFQAPLSGSYYGPLIERAEEEKRVTNVPYEPNLPVETWWDLGISDQTAVWFVQRHGLEMRAIDYEEAAGLSLADWAKIIKEKPYHYSAHIGPHDLEVREYSTGKTRRDFAREVGLNFTTAPRLPVQEGIDIVRRLLPRLWFDETKCYKGIEALKSYRKEYDDKRQVFADKPLHDWSSHASDAFRTGAVTTKPRSTKPRATKAPTFDPYAAGRRGAPLRRTA